MAPVANEKALARTRHGLFALPRQPSGTTRSRNGSPSKTWSATRSYHSQSVIVTALAGQRPGGSAREDRVGLAAAVCN